MILEALRREAAAAVRSPLRIAALAAFLGASALAILAGSSFQTEWEASLESAAAQQAEAAAEVRGWFEAGSPGPTDRPWVDVGQARWMDSYAGTRVLREPAALAGIATGSVDDSPRVVPVTRTADPFGDEGAKIENPELGSTEAIDLIFVLAVLVPLLVGALGVGCGAMERETGIDRLIAVQRGRASSWFLAQAVAIFAVVAVAVVAVVAAAVVSAGAFGTDGLLLLVLALLYTALWSGLLTATAVAARSVREAALSYGGAWVLLVVLTPALQSELALAHAASEPHHLQGALETRSARYDTFETDVTELLDALYLARPELLEQPAAKAEQPSSAVRRHTYDWTRVQGTLDKHRRALEDERAAAREALGSMAFSPASTLTLATERLAGRDLAAAMEFRSVVVTAVEARMDWVLDAAWADEPLTVEDFDAVVAATPTSLQPRSGGIGLHLVVLLAWTALAWTVGVVRVRAREPRD